MSEADTTQQEWERDIRWAVEAGTPIAELTESTGLSAARIEAICGEDA